MRFPFSARVLAARLRDVEEALVSWDEQSRQQALEQEQVIQHLGERLFDGLFTGSVRRPYDATLNQAARQHKGLRLKLCIEPPELALVPWELLYDQRPEKYVCHFPG
jgi:hypothetical protein